MLISTHAPAGGATRVAIEYRQWGHFYSRPCGRGDVDRVRVRKAVFLISTHAPAGGATRRLEARKEVRNYFYSRPCGRGDTSAQPRQWRPGNFYSRPCGRGDPEAPGNQLCWFTISTHAPAGGATRRTESTGTCSRDFYSRPCGRGDVDGQTLARVLFISTHAPAGGATDQAEARPRAGPYFYSRPCGRGDSGVNKYIYSHTEFLLTPLREGRRSSECLRKTRRTNFYSRPCGRGDEVGECQRPLRAQFLLTPLREGRPAAPRRDMSEEYVFLLTPLREGRRRAWISSYTASAFLLTPLREGRRKVGRQGRFPAHHFYSRPCGRGDQCVYCPLAGKRTDFYSRPCGRGDVCSDFSPRILTISTHAPAGGATLGTNRVQISRYEFLLTPLREGRRGLAVIAPTKLPFLLTPLREGRPHQN